MAVHKNKYFFIVVRRATGEMLLCSSVPAILDNVMGFDATKNQLQYVFTHQKKMLHKTQGFIVYKTECFKSKKIMDKHK